MSLLYVDQDIRPADTLEWTMTPFPLVTFVDSTIPYSEYYSGYYCTIDTENALVSLTIKILAGLMHTRAVFFSLIFSSNVCLKNLLSYSHHCFPLLANLFGPVLFFGVQVTSFRLSVGVLCLSCLHNSSLVS